MKPTEEMQKAIIKLQPTGRYIDLGILRVELTKWEKKHPRKTKKDKLTIRHILDKIMLQDR